MEKNLLPDEKIIYRTQKHLIIFLVPVIWTLITLFFVFNPNPLIVKISFAPSIAAIATWINGLINYLSSSFTITNKRILMTEGFFIRHSNELRLNTISNISINQTLLGRLLNYGTVLIYPFAGNKDVFSEINAPFEFQKQLEMQVEKKFIHPA